MLRLPEQSQPVIRGNWAVPTREGILPAGHTTQCCGTNCTTVYCFLGASSKGCCGNNPYVCCIGGAPGCPPC
jgi:hypothetical protein